MTVLRARWLGLCLCLLALLIGAASQSSAVPEVTSVSGCSDVGTMTVNCTYPALLTVRGSGFLTNITKGPSLSTNAPIYWIDIAIELSTPAVAAGLTVSDTSVRPSGQFPVNDTYFVFVMGYLGRGVYAEGVALSLTIHLGTITLASRGLQVSSSPFVGVTISAVPPPVVDTITGCPIVSADQQSVAQCLPDRDVLTLTGSGFLQWQVTALRLSMGTVQTSLYLALVRSTTPYDWIFNDTVITVVTNNAYRYLLAAHDFGAPPPLPFAIVEKLSGWQSKSGMTIQFDTLPPPSYSSIAPFVFYSLPMLPGCVWGPNRTSMVNCTAGYAGISLSGQYLYEVVATIGGQPMTVMPRAQQDVKLISLVTPLYNFEPGVLYDFVLTAASGSITTPNYVSFAGLPTIVSAACRDPMLPVDIASLACQPGETVTMNGPYLPPPTTAFTVTVHSHVSMQNVSCSNPRYNSAYQLACDMLVPGLPATNGWDTWSATSSLCC